MSGPTIRNLNEERLSVEDRNALAILRHLSLEKVNRLKVVLAQGDPGVVGPQTLDAFRRLCERHGFDLTPSGVSAFKAAHRLGDVGSVRGVIGAQTAGVYYDQLMSLVSGTLTKADGLLGKLLAITGTFEGSGYANLAGDFDKQGISFGILQWNVGQGSLPPLLSRMHQRDPVKFHEIFGEETDQLLAVLRAGRANQMRFARAILDERKRVLPRWRARFRQLGDYPPFQQVQREFAQTRLDEAKKLARKYRLTTERGLALMFDIVVQNGSISDATHGKIVRAKESQEKAMRRSLTEREFLEIIANKRADAAKAQWREDVRARKLTIVRGTGRVHGRHLDLSAQFGLTNGAWA